MATKNDKTRGIVLTTTPSNERTQLVRFYTEEFGRVTCRIPLLNRGKKANQMRTMMTPMTMLELVLTGNPNDEIRQIGEAQVLQSPYLLTLSHPAKGAQCLYMAELLSRTVREMEPNARLWQYVSGCLEILQNCETGWANFHLLFTSGLCSQLGFCIDTESYQPGCKFDLIEGEFTNATILHPYYLNPLSASWFCRLLETRFDEMDQLQLNRQERAALLDMQLAFLGQHIPEMGRLKSVDVLKSLFDE